MPDICVFCSSSDAVDAAYFDAAEHLGRIIGSRGYGLVYGGARVGLMGTLARSAMDAGAQVTGVMPEAMVHKGIALDGVHEFLSVPDLRTRKAEMEQRACAFIALPGGFGTLEELLEMLTARQLGLHEKPVVILNINGFYEGLLNVFETMYGQSFAKKHYAGLYYVTNDPNNALDYIRDYQPADLGGKWF